MLKDVVFFSTRWAKGGVLLEGARESVFVTTADHSFFTEPVSCQVFNAVGNTNVSILVDVHCESIVNSPVLRRTIKMFLTNRHVIFWLLLQ